jgi:gamma-glutamyltranspeptidase/glutathione hydrolase
LAFGTPGGDQQDQWSLLLLLRAVHPVRDRGLQAAIDAPMLHTEHAPSSFYPREAHPRRVVVEDRWPAAVRRELERRGHEVVVAPGWSLGRLSAVADERGPDGEGWLRGAANARGSQGYAVGR